LQATMTVRGGTGPGPDDGLLLALLQRLLSRQGSTGGFITITKAPKRPISMIRSKAYSIRA